MKKHIFKSPGHGKIRIHLAGCGGTGSQMLTCLARMDLALRNLGGDGLQVTAFDPDTVSPANAGRQSFYSCDLGKNKAQVLADRHRLCFPGFAVEGVAEKYSAGRYCSDHEILITCVDSRSARREIFAMRPKGIYHVDCGNGPNHGQVLLGNGKDLPYPEKVLPDLIAEGRKTIRLPAPWQRLWKSKTFS